MTTNESTLQISGMTCSACATRVEKGIAKMDGVHQANVNFPLEQLTVQYDATTINESDFKEKVEKLGYGVMEQKAEFDVTGMTCSACANRIEKVLKKMAGVSEVNVNLALETATVTYNERDVQPQDMIEKVKKMGYELFPKQDEHESLDHREAEIKKQKVTFIFSLVLTLPLLWTMVAHFSFLSFIYLPDILMNPWVQLAFATPVQFIVGAQFYKGAYTSLKNKSANMDVLVALGTSAAYFYSLYLTLEWVGAGSVGEAELYFEAAAVIITLIVLGKLFEVRAKG